MQHIASRQALQEVTDALVSRAGSLSDDDLVATGSELAGVAGLMRANPPLRRVLSESSTDPDSRRELLRGLLTGKVSPTALELSVEAVGRSWATGADLRTAIDRLGRTAVLLAAERAGRLDTVEDELFRFGRIVDGSPELSVLLDDPTADGAAKRTLVDSLLQGKADPLTVQLLTALAADAQGRSFSRGVRELVLQAAERRDELVAEVRSAVALDSEQTSRLAAALERIYQRRVAVHVEVDPQLLGGLRIAVGDEVIDGSTSGRLASLGRRLGRR